MPTGKMGQVRPAVNVQQEPAWVCFYLSGSLLLFHCSASELTFFRASDKVQVYCFFCSAPNASFYSTEPEMGAWGTRSQIVAYVFPAAPVQVRGLHLNSCAYELKREVLEVAMKLFQTHFPTDLEYCSTGCEVPSLQCRAGTTGCREPSLVSLSVPISCEQTTFALLFLWTVIHREAPQQHKYLRTGKCSALHVMRQGVFWLKDRTCCSDTFLRSKDCSWLTKRPQSTQLSCCTPRLFLKVSATDIHP